MADLATYSITMAIEGMKVPGEPEGAGDRKIDFSMAFDATNAEQADEIWYEHMKIFFGDEQEEQLKAFAERMRRGR